MCGFLAPKPKPSWASSPGGRNLPFFYLQDLASTSSGPYLHFLQELCWLHNPPLASRASRRPQGRHGRCCSRERVWGGVSDPQV